MKEWPLRARFFCWTDVVYEAVGIMQDNAENWVASQAVESGNLEFLNMTDVFNECVFYDGAEKAAQELA